MPRTILLVGSLMFFVCVLVNVVALAAITDDAANETRKLGRDGRRWLFASFITFSLALGLLVLVLVFNS